MSGKNNKKNIVIINDFDYVQGGASKVAIETANKLAENDKLIVYFFSGATKNENELNPNIIQICTNQGEALKNKNRSLGCINGLYNVKAKKTLKKLLKRLEKKNTIVHIHGWTKCLSSSIFDVIFNLKFKCIVTIHDYFTVCPNGGFFDYKKNEICELFPLSHKCVICNCDSRNYFFKLYRVLRSFIQNKIVKLTHKIEYLITISDLSEKVLKKYFNKDVYIKRINNPIDIDKSKELSNVKNNDYFLYVGRVSKEKGVEVFCEAITKAQKKGIVVGDGNQLEYLKNKYNNIEFTGWKCSEEVKQYMKKAKCLIFPSKWFEGAPLTPIEAMQYGVPCLISSCCSAKEYIKNENGLIFEPNTNDLIKKIDMLENHLVKYSLNSYEYVNQIEKIDYIKNIIEFYNEILEEK